MRANPAVQRLRWHVFVQFACGTGEAAASSAATSTRHERYEVLVGSVGNGLRMLFLGVVRLTLMKDSSFLGLSSYLVTHESQ